MAEADIQRREVYYSGSVQGVGFRYTVRMLATRFHVTGFVRNLRDGRVELVAEGPKDELRRFIEAIGAEMGRYVTAAEEKTGPAAGQFRSFDIRF